MNLSKPDPYGNVGIIRLNRELLNLPVDELTKTSDIVDTFIKQGVLLSTDVDTVRNLLIYRLSHPDFTLPDNTEYTLYLTKTQTDPPTVYISKLCGYTANNLVPVKVYHYAS